MTILVSSCQVLDVLPSIGQYDTDHSPAYLCSVCNATLPVTQKVTNSRGQLRTILATPKECHNCGAPTAQYPTLAEKDLHESVLDTLHRGDSRFIVDHRRFQNSHAARFSPKNNSGIRESSSPMDWRDDIESFRLHMSRQSEYEEEDLGTRNQECEQKRSESGSSSVFMTEPGTNIDKLNEPPDVRRAWDDSHTRAVITRDDGNDSEDWVKGKENKSYSTDLDAYSDFEMIEDYDPESGFTVRLRRRPFGGVKQTSYVIHGIQDEEAAGNNSISKGGKRQQHGKEKSLHNRQGVHIDAHHYGEEKNGFNKQGVQTDAHHYGKEKNLNSKQGTQTDAHKTKSSKNRESKQTSIDRKTSKRVSHDVNENEDKKQENETNQNTKHAKKNTLSRTESFYTVGLDQRDYVFSESPIIEEVDDEEDDVDIIFSATRFSDDTFSDFEFHGDDWSPGSLRPGSHRPTMPTPVDDQVIILLKHALIKLSNGSSPLRCRYLDLLSVAPMSLTP